MRHLYIVGPTAGSGGAKALPMPEGSKQWYIMDGAEGKCLPAAFGEPALGDQGVGYAEYTDSPEGRVPYRYHVSGAPLTHERVALLNTVPFVIQHDFPDPAWLAEDTGLPESDVRAPYQFLIETLGAQQEEYWVNLLHVPTALQDKRPDHELA